MRRPPAEVGAASSVLAGMYVTICRNAGVDYPARPAYDMFW
jgi:hypothetical protein